MPMHNYQDLLMALPLPFPLPPIDTVIPILPLYSNVTFQMYKRKDSDIFGTADLGYAPRIHNPSFVDPHAAFRKRTELNYERYQAAVTSTPQTITARPLDASKVNEEAAFEEDYHRLRKEQDMQSSIFYPPRQRPPSARQNENDPHLANKPQEGNYGRKEVFKREISGLPLNTAQLRGNSSRLFDLDERTKAREEGVPLAPLIPHQMSWDQHDSIKYSHINPQKETRKETSVVNCVEESKSTVFEPEEKTETKPAKSIEKKVQRGNTKQEKKSSNDGKRSASDSIQIKIIKGWDHKYMEGLSKHCKLNNSAIMGFEIDSEGKVTLTLKRSTRWENVTDWLRKDCKLRLRI